MEAYLDLIGWESFVIRWVGNGPRAGKRRKIAQARIQQRLTAGSRNSFLARVAGCLVHAFPNTSGGTRIGKESIRATEWNLRPHANR